MNILSNFTLAWSAVRRNPVRTLMTVLGVAWGITAFMVLMAYGTGMRQSLMLGLSYFGDNVVVVQDGQTSKQAGGQKAGRAIFLEKDDVELLRSEATLIKRVSAEVFRRYKVSYELRQTTAGIRAGDPCYGEIRGMFIESGRFFNSEENNQMARVAVLGSEIRDRLFSSVPAVGKEIKIRGIKFQVIGVVHKKIAISNYYSPDDMCVMIPFRTMSLMTDTRYLSNLVYQPVSPLFEEAAKKQMMTLLGRRHNFAPDDDKALTGWSYSMVKEIIDGICNATDVTMVIVGLITLGIGGVGVMNIMLLSVKSRTREIGTLKALGAKRRHVLAQFLTETFILTLAGGALGCLLAFGLTSAIGGIPFLSSIFKDPSHQGDIYLNITAGAFTIAVVFLGGVSLFFGLWPALQAARQEPIEALRYE